MDRLAASEFRRIHGFLRAALDADGDDAFPPPVLEALRRLIPCEVISYGHYAARGRRWAIRTAPDGVAPVPRPISAAHLRLQDQDPFLPSHRTVGRAVRQSDLMSPRELHALEFYQGVARPLGIEYSMQLWLLSGDEIVGGFGFDAAAADFSERDLAVLDFLAPDLLRLHQRAATRRRLDGETDAVTVLTHRELEVVRLVAVGLTNAEIARTLFISPGTVRKHLDNVYARLGVRSRALRWRSRYDLPEAEHRRARIRAHEQRLALAARARASAIDGRRDRYVLLHCYELSARRLSASATLGNLDGHGGVAQW